MKTKKAATLVPSAVQPAKQDGNQSNLAYLHVSVKTIPLELVKRDPKTQQRTGLNLDTVEEYQEAISLGAKFPPIKVRFDGKLYYLWDGFHTVQAYSNLNKTEIEAEVTPGSLRDAILDSVGANSTHGLRRTREDKRKAVMALLYDEEWMEWSNREIARKCNVSYQFVNNLKKKLCNKDTDKEIITGEFPSDNQKKYKDRYGNESVMDTSNIGQINNTKDDDTITTSFKRNSNLENDKAIITDNVVSDNQKENNNTTQKVLITSDYRKGESGIITQHTSANSSIIEFPDGTREIFQRWHYKMLEEDKLDKLINQAATGFERQSVNFKEGDIVLIDPTNRVDDRLVGYAKRHAQITKLHDYTADIKVWGIEIDSVSLTDLQPLRHDFVSQGISIQPKDYAFLMANFESLEDVVKYAISKKKQHPGFKGILNG